MTLLPNSDQECEVLKMPERITAVYFLMKEGRVMYVGMSRNLIQRTWLHELHKDFDEVRFLRCTDEDVEEVERYWIEFYDPPWKSCTNTKFKRMYSPPERIGATASEFD